MTSSELLEQLRGNPFVLAPMAGITDQPFRSLMRELGCGVVVSELVSATGLKYSSAKTRKLMEFESMQHPVGIQLFGETLDHLRDAAQMVEQTGADFVDLNFGCPVPKVVNKGAGSACLKDLTKLRDVIRATKSALTIPLTIKVRTGWDQQTRNSEQVAQVAYDEGVTWVAIHGRTRAAAYTGLADWDYIREVKRTSPVPILGNGDIASSRQANARLMESGCDGVMIGRGCLKNPRIFMEARAGATGAATGGATGAATGGATGAATGAIELPAILRRMREHLESFYEERMVLLQMRKFASWYSAGLPGAAQFRKDLFFLQSRDEVLGRIDRFYLEMAGQAQLDTSHEPFLMGGHG